MLEMRKKMNNSNCSSCGYKFKATDEVCPYCGSSNPSFKKKAEIPFFNTQPRSESTYQSNYSTESNDEGINVCILIILLFVFWPAAVIYAIVKSSKK